MWIFLVIAVLFVIVFIENVSTKSAEQIRRNESSKTDFTSTESTRNKNTAQVSQHRTTEPWVDPLLAQRERRRLEALKLLSQEKNSSSIQERNAKESDPKDISKEKSKIRSAAKIRNIEHLLHFTRASNLESIIVNGLVPKDELSRNNTPFIDNDDLRLDGHLDSVSLSISFPNYKMFFKYRNELKSNYPADDFVVLELHPDILWELDCAFCRHNAASKSMKQLDIDTLKSTEIFESMFAVDEEDTRISDRLKSFDPTDSQAELLVFETISPKYIASVNFENKRSYMRAGSKRVKSLSQIDPYYFQSRRAARYGFATRIHNHA